MAFVTVADARSWLGIDRTDYDTLIGRALDKACEVVEDWTGQTYSTASVTEYHDGGRPVIRLRSNPVQSITTVTEQIGRAHV